MLRIQQVIALAVDHRARYLKNSRAALLEPLITNQTKSCGPGVRTPVGREVRSLNFLDERIVKAAGKDYVVHAVTTCLVLRIARALGVRPGELIDHIRVK